MPDLNAMTAEEWINHHHGEILELPNNFRIEVMHPTEQYDGHDVMHVFDGATIQEAKEKAQEFFYGPALKH